MKTIDIEEARTENWQKEVLAIRKSFEDAIRHHCKIVDLKTGHLIAERRKGDGEKKIS